MKRTIFLLLVIAATTANAQTKADYDNVMLKFMHYLNNHQPDSIYYNMASEKWKSSLTLEKSNMVFTQLAYQWGNIESYELISLDGGLATYKMTAENAEVTLLAGLGKDNKLETFRIMDYKDKSVKDTFKKEKSNFEYKSAYGTIYGTLATPKGGKKVPVVLIIAGSGPTDRDCNNAMGLKSYAFRMLADSLKKAGIACLRYDKRGVGESSAAFKDEESLRLGDYVDDAVGMIKILKKDPRFSKVYIIGHSEGSLIGMIAASREPVAGFISVSGPGDDLAQLLKKQVSAGTPDMAAKANAIIDSIRNGFIARDIPSSLLDVFRPSIEPYLASCFRYNPQTEIKKLKIPVMVMQGGNDIQVGVSDAQLLKKACPKARLVIVKGMNHVLKQAPTGREQNFATYNKPDLPLSPGFVPDIVTFIEHAK